MAEVPGILKILIGVAAAAVLLAAILGIVCALVVLILKTLDYIGVWLDEHPERGKK